MDDIIYCAATHIGVKANQDRTSDNHHRLVLCDGVGEFPQSEIAAETLISNINFMDGYSKQALVAHIDEAKIELERKKINGGTTMLLADANDFAKEGIVHLAYVGNGAIFQFGGDFTELGEGFDAMWLPFRYTNLVIPHVEKDNALTRYIGPNVLSEDSMPTFMDIELNNGNGDALLMVTDGIASLENDLIMQDDAGRIWQLRSTLVHELINSIFGWLKDSDTTVSNEGLQLFLGKQLTGMKEKGMLEDDASIGLIFTKEFLKKNKNES